MKTTITLTITAPRKIRVTVPRARTRRQTLLRAAKLALQHITVTA